MEHLFENTLPGAVGSDREVNGKRFPSLAAQILAWREAFSSFYLPAVANMECVLYAPQVCWEAGAFHNCPKSWQGSSVPLAGGGGGWVEFGFSFSICFRSWAAAHLCLAQHWALSVPLISWKSSELQLFCHFAMMEEALGILVVVCPGTVVHLGVPGAPAQSCVCRWGRADAAPWAHAAFSLAFPE